MRLLVLNFFPAFTPASSGGELRVGCLYRALSARHEVTMLTSTDFGARCEQVRHTPGFVEWRFPKDRLWAQAYATLEAAGLAGDLSGLAFALAVSDPDCALRRMARELAPQMDRVVHEFPFSEPVFADMADTADAPCEIYNSHNFETSLLGSVVHGPGFDAALLKLMRLEGNLARRAGIVFATSAADAEKFRLFYGVPAGRLALCPNGFDEAELEPVTRLRATVPRVGANENSRMRVEQAPSEAAALRPHRPRLLFTGSAHPPNVEAAHFLAELAHALPECDLVLAGSVGTALEAAATSGHRSPGLTAGPVSLPDNLLRLGGVDPAAKHRLLIEADLFLNPVTLGSGTSLKALEALGAGVPMVSTEEGVRGLGVVDGVHAAVTPRGRFAETVRGLLADAPARRRLADAGREMARRLFTWEAIAASYAARLQAAAETVRRSPPLLLALNDYPVLGANSGGMARVRGLLGELGRADKTDFPNAADAADTAGAVVAEVVLVSFGATAEFVLLGPGLLHVTLPKTPAHAAFEAALRDGQPASADDVAAALFVGANRLMAAVLPELARRAGAVVLEHCYMAPALELIRSAAEGAGLPVIYSSHNVEATHKPPLLAGHVAAASLQRFVASLEARLVEQARLIVCCTEADARHFEAALAVRPAASRPAVLVVANGCVLPDLTGEPPSAERPHAVAGFLGSAHGPNVEAAEFILRELAPGLPHVAFELVGGVCEAVAGAGPGAGPWPDNVRLRGVLDEAAKSAVLAGWTIALNPVISGGGSSLKLPDYMAHGLPSLNTPAGARGFAVAERGAGIVVEQTLFVHRLAALLAEPARLAEMGEQARRYAAEALSWRAASAPYRERLAGLLAPSPPLSSGPSPAARRPSLLVVTYRYTEPTLGGAEEYLAEILPRLRPRLGRLDLACVDVGALTNYHHFATRAAPGEGVTRRLGAAFDALHCLAADPADEAATLAQCRDLERAWTAEEELLLLGFAPRLAGARPVLFAGFYWPENHDGILRRWTSPRFSILVPAEAVVLRLTGWASEQKHLRIEMLRLPVPPPGAPTDVAPPGAPADVAPPGAPTDVTPPGAAGEGLVRLGGLDRTLSGNFVASFGLPAIADAGAGLLLRLSVDETQSPGDHRPFGVLLETVSILRPHPAAGPTGGLALLEECQADFAAENDRTLRAADFPGWVAALHEVAAQRSPGLEAAFAAVRGPHSAALQAWLAAHGETYDVVLVQGVPFDVVPSTVATLAALPRRPRIVTLPHFHADDRFYHWRRFAEAFELADATLVFTPSLPALLGGCGGGRFAVVPGGGVRPDEHGDPTARRRFAEAHPGGRPFYLVLGRKTPSKGYRRVLAAHAARRQADPDSPDLVLIGPDEDGQPVGGPGVAYLGRQSREVIRGALAACLAVVTMSESESFGIVLCEAWLFGRPVIANAACYSFRDLVAHERTGLLVTTDAELADALERLACDPALARSMGEAGFAIVQQHYTWAHVADAIADVLEVSKKALLF